MKKQKSGIGMKIIIIILFCSGLGLILYPTVSDIHNRYVNTKYQRAYQSTVKQNTSAENLAIWKAARRYNRLHQVNTVADMYSGSSGNQTPEYRSYLSTLNPQGNGMMGYLEIPKINAEISIFHGTGTKVLEKGIGHVEGTSLPVGGTSTHSVMAAHRGLPGARLFTDLDKLKKGDRFYIHVLNKTLAYEVDRVKVVLPEQMMKYCQIDEGKDEVTLVTCTPYGVNTHRMLVRGHRVPLDQHAAVNPFMRYVKLGLFLAAVLALLVGWYVWKKKRKQ